MGDDPVRLSAWAVGRSPATDSKWVHGSALKSASGALSFWRSAPRRRQPRRGVAWHRDAGSLACPAAPMERVWLSLAMDNRKRLSEAEKTTPEDMVRMWERQAETYAPYLNRRLDFVVVDWKEMYESTARVAARGKEARIVSGVKENSPADPSFQLRVAWHPRS